MIVLTATVQALALVVLLACLLVGVAVGRQLLTTRYPDPED